MSSMTLFGDGKVFPRHQLASDLQDMRPLLGTLRYNLHDFGRIVSSNTRSCVEDMTTRRLGLYLRPTAVRVRYSSCRYNERQLIDVTVVRRARPRAERRYHAYHHVRTYIRIWYIIRTWYHTYLVHNTYLVS